MTVASADRRRDDTSSRVLAVGAAVVGLVVVGVGLALMADRNAATNLLAFIYESLGNFGGADELRRGVGDQLLAKVILGVIALLIGVGAIWLVYIGVAAIVGLLSPRWQSRIIPWVFVVPALFLLTVYLVYPTIGTIWTSLTVQTDGDPLKHYQQIFGPQFIGILRNNVVWLIFGTAGSVILGLIIAALVDRVRREALAKTFIFLPLAISFIGASVIWRFMYDWNPPIEPQIGVVNAVVVGLGGTAVRWVETPPINTFALITIFVWLQTGFAMVVLSAAIKGVPVDILEASRLDGASERQTFFKVVVPMIRGTIIAVATTIAIAVLKVFDIVYVMTGGRFDTDVVANRMFLEMFQFFNTGRAAAFATLLFLAVLPIMFINVRNLRRQGVGA